MLCFVCFFYSKIGIKASDVENNEMCVSTTKINLPWEVLIEEKGGKRCKGESDPYGLMGVYIWPDQTQKRVVVSFPMRGKLSRTKKILEPVEAAHPLQGYTLS